MVRREKAGVYAREKERKMEQEWLCVKKIGLGYHSQMERNVFGPSLHLGSRGKAGMPRELAFLGSPWTALYERKKDKQVSFVPILMALPIVLVVRKGMHFYHHWGNCLPAFCKATCLL